MIRVMLVDDQNLVRKGVRSLLELSEEIEVIAEAPDGIEAIRSVGFVNTLAIDFVGSSDPVASIEQAQKILQQAIDSPRE